VPFSHALRGEARKVSQEWLDRLVAEADGDDERLLHLCADHLEVVDEHGDRVRRELRDPAAQRLREAGVPMKRIATLARITDSALARRILHAGSKRRVDRRRREYG
jgi:chemotaxis regulatin CheY-phosphate phosphatase CheZ